MKRFNSDPSRSQVSSILGGNLLDELRDVESLSDDNFHTDFTEEDLNNPENSIEGTSLDSVFEPVTFDDVKKADELLYTVFGINVVSCFTRLVLMEKILPADFVCQSLAYKCQSLLRGNSGVRYLKSWGMFWAAVRNIVKTRGLVAFRDHFCIPALSQLVKFKKQIIKLCGLDESLLGKSGLQSSSVNKWLDAKSSEFMGKTLAVSVSMDGKKISVTKEGTEDMGGIKTFKSKETETEEYDSILKQILGLWEKWVKEKDRASLFSLYDILSYSSQQIVSKLVALKTLEASNMKRQEKNPNLAKYVHVLKSEVGAGHDLIRKVCEIQFNVIKLIAEARLSGHLLPRGAESDLLNQANYRRLKQLSPVEDNTNIAKIDRFVKNKTLLEIPWSLIIKELGTLSSIPRGSKSSCRLGKLCYLSSEQVFRACGLGLSRPLQDMKNIYQQSHSLPPTLPGTGHGQTDLDLGIVKSFCATMAPMTFGMNCQIQESGVFIQGGVSSVSDFLVVDFVGVVQFTVKTILDPKNVFNLDEESIAQCVVDSYICHSKKGSLVVQYNDLMMTVASVPADNSLAQELLSFCDSYIRADRCLTRRTQEITIRQEKIRQALKSLKDSLKILGSYPLATQVISNSPCLSENETLPHQFKELMGEKRRFLSKQARELIAVNVSDVSGNPSSSPHTTLAATFLSSVPLKVVGGKCIGEVIEMVEKKNCKCINIAVDGESLHFATCLPNGNPGTELSLVKALYKRMQSLSKDNLIRLVSQNKAINIDDTQLDQDEVDDIEDQLPEPELIDNLEETVACVQVFNDLNVNFSLEDIENMLKCERSDATENREIQVRKIQISRLRLICLKHIFAVVKKNWLVSHLGQGTVAIFFQDGEKYDYTPSNVFHSVGGVFRTISFDYAHLINLFRESAAKGKLTSMGLSPDNLGKLSRSEGFTYLQKIILLQNGKLKFDSMNQSAAEMLYSQQTVDGLKKMNDLVGAKCVDIISRGLSALDTSGISSDLRVRNLINLKNFLIEKNNLIDRLKRPDSKNITNELFTMTLCSIDSHIFTYLNLEFFNPRRKSTGTVEQLFGQLMMMTDGSSRLNVRQLQDVLQRLCLTSALRLLPHKMRGFEFLGKLNVHMKSYKPDDFEVDNATASYPCLNTSQGTVSLKNSSFDVPSVSRKKSKLLREHSTDDFDGNVRKYHKKS